MPLIMVVMHQIIWSHLQIRIREVRADFGIEGNEITCHLANDDASEDKPPPYMYSTHHPYRLIKISLPPIMEQLIQLAMTCLIFVHEVGKLGGGNLDNLGGAMWL